MINKMRLWLIKKLLKDSDGYTFTGFREEEPIKFYYCKDIDKYLLGMRSDNWYYFEPTLSGWSSYSSRYLPWGETVERPDTMWKVHTYPNEPEEIDFRKWVFGILDMVHNQYIDEILSMDTEELIKRQNGIKKGRELVNKFKCKDS